MASSEKLVVTLTAERGAKFDKTGEAIASHNRSIVFLPRGTEPGKNYRVVLEEIPGKTDRGGRAMYRAVPAEIEYTERWKDNGDGTVSKLVVQTDWLFEETVWDAGETRVPASREGQPRERVDRSVKWGIDLATSYVEVVKVNIIPLETEKVSPDRQLVWVKTGERQEPQAPVTLPISRVEGCPCDWQTRRLRVSYDPNLLVVGVAFYQPEAGGSEQFLSFSSTWGQMPQWWQNEQEAAYPACPCNRQRREMQADGYAKCELCRAEEVCARCGKQAKITVIGGRMICAACQPYEAAEQLIAAEFSSARRETIAAEAKRLLSGQALEREAGEVILRTTVDHITDSWQRSQLLQKWAGFGWYYFGEDGVYGSKMAPAALQLLQFLPSATGNGLVELVAWLVGGPKAGSPDYYLRTQINGETGVSLPTITGDLLKQAVVADRLRGSETDRQLALALCPDSVFLQNEEQDYRAALVAHKAATEASARRQERIDAGEIWPDVKVNISTASRTSVRAWTIMPDGFIMEPLTREDTGGRNARICAYWYGDLPSSAIVISHEHDDYGYRVTERWEVHHLPAAITPQQAETLKRLEEESRQYFTGRGAGWDVSAVGVRAVCSAYHRDFVGEEQELDLEMRSNSPIDVAQWATQIDENGTHVVGPYRAGTSVWEATIRRADGFVADGRWVKLCFRKGRHHKTGETQWEAGNRHVKYVLDRYAERQPVEGREYYCSLGKILVDTPNFRLQLVRLEPPFPEDAPPIEAEQSSEPTGATKVAPEMLAALKARWEGNK